MDLPRIPASGERTKSTADSDSHSDSNYWPDQSSDAKDDVAPGYFYCVKIAQYEAGSYDPQAFFFGGGGGGGS
jgi:hypothetical protein